MKFSDMVKMQREKTLKKNLSSVGPSYQLDYDRISDEMTEIAIQMRGDPNNYVDVADAYEEWERRNYDIDIRDEYGDKDYDAKLYDMVDDKIHNYDMKWRNELMNKIYDLQYNDYVSFVQGNYYVKSTNGNDSYNGCKIWAGPSKNDDSGWYFDVEDFIEVIEPSYSGESIFGF